MRSHLPRHAREIYLAAFNNAWEEYAGREDREIVAHKFAGSEFGRPQGRPRSGEPQGWGGHKVAWAAVKKQYVKAGKDWIRKQEPAEDRSRR